MWCRRDKIIHDIDVEFNACHLVWSSDDFNGNILPYLKNGKRYGTVHSDEGSEPGDGSDDDRSDSSDCSRDGGAAGDDGFPFAVGTLRTGSAEAEPSAVADAPSVVTQPTGSLPPVLARTAAEADTVHTYQHRLDVLRVAL